MRLRTKVTLWRHDRVPRTRLLCHKMSLEQKLTCMPYGTSVCESLIHVLVTARMSCSHSSIALCNSAALFTAEYALMQPTFKPEKGWVDETVETAGPGFDSISPENRRIETTIDRSSNRSNKRVHISERRPNDRANKRRITIHTPKNRIHKSTSNLIFYIECYQLIDLRPRLHNNGYMDGEYYQI